MVSKSGKVRIIAGKWRSRVIHFPAEPNLRPTPDSIRETLFNWLMPFIGNAVCLDLFAGSGALGFEALSRGAKEVVMVDEQRKVVSQLKQNAELLGAESLSILQGQAPLHVPNLSDRRFDLAFLDPPFASQLVLPCCKWLEEQNLLNPAALIYMETNAAFVLPPDLAASWELFRSKKSGNVYYCLYQKHS